ncbi:MAG: hybrid sensor histidine kinase/response regulator [Magnetococcales bacterium]|nr:hybrid sensor histidine kinase/response regulator [Magnetococcales bacterium]
MQPDPPPPRVLIVDDVPANIKVLLPTLQPDFVISIATSGQQALQLAETQKPDLILLDIIMPEVDGYEVCSRLKANETTRDIPVIFITAKDDEADEMTGLELGAVDYITKPFSAPIVHARTKTHLGLKRAREKIENQNKELIKAAELREEVNRIMRHDLKTPLNAIIGFSDLLLNNPKCPACEPDHHKMLEIIRESGYRLLEMINSSLDLYKMEQGTYLLHPQPVDILGVVHKIRQAFLDRIKLKRLEVVWQENEGELFGRCLVLGEELLCYSLFANLLKNAIEAAPVLSQITIGCQCQQGEALITIHNFGAVPAEMVERFFDKYATSGKVGGTGLGTYSALLIARVQNGTITMETSEQHGTTLRVVLPLPADGQGAE